MNSSSGKAQVVKEIHKYARKKFPRRRFIQKGLDDTWQIDLIDLQKYSKDNRGYKYILICIDTFSKYAWAQPLKTKKGDDVVKAMYNILNETNKRKPKNIQSDDGKEFFNSKFTALMKKYSINHYSTYSVMKASIAERLIRTLKHWLWQEFSLNGSYNWTKYIKAIMKRYNTKKHSTIGIPPTDVNENNSLDILSKHYNHIKIKAPAKYKVGEHVRISKYKSVFAKGYTGNWTTEIFKIYKIQTTNPVTYLLQDVKDEPIAGSFYEQELQKVKYPDVYLVEKVLKRKGNKIYVKWLGMNEKSWIDKNNIV